MCSAAPVGKNYHKTAQEDVYKRQVWGFDKLIESHTGIETHVADDAISCVAYGTGKSLDDVDSMQDGTINLSRRKQMN